MEYNNNKVSNIKIAYIGGGSRNWAWSLMSDLVKCDDISGDVYLYDIDYEAAKNNVIIGEKANSVDEAKSIWHYHAVKTIEESLKDANFVVISILPGTFDEMESDVHAGEKYGIYQSVGDTSGPGGIIRAMRTIPMYEEFALKIKEYCPNAWVINYTNPMTLCTKSLYRSFENIKAFGCCHEVFGTQRFLAKVLKETKGIDNVDRSEIKVNVLGVNHFTWITSAKYKNIDLMPLYKEFVKKYKNIGYNAIGNEQDNWKTNTFRFDEMVKMDLYDSYGYIAAAGDRHLAEFCEGKSYLENPERVKEMHFGLTTVDFRRKKQDRLIEKSIALSSGTEPVKLIDTGEEGVHQIRALLGLCDLVTNVNTPNRGQIPNLPIGAVVESNAVFRADSLNPVFAGNIPESIYPLIARISGEQEALSTAIHNRDLKAIYAQFRNDPLVTCSEKDAKALFKELCMNTKKYLTSYDLSQLEEI